MFNNIINNEEQRLSTFILAFYVVYKELLVIKHKEKI